ADVSFYGSMIDADVLHEKLLDQMKTNWLLPARLAAKVNRHYWRARSAENRTFRRSVLNISSVSGLYVYPDVGQAGYSASKAALNFLTCHMASDYRAVGIRVNALAPTSFPDVIPTESVTAEVRKLLYTGESGKIYLMDTDGFRPYN